MPPATRRVSTRQQAASAASRKAASGAVKKQNAARAAPVPVSYMEEGDACAICLEELKTKRTIQIQPCGHLFHRTCALRLTETRTCTCGQRCPICRGGMKHLLDSTENVPMRFLETFGSLAQPTMWYITDQVKQFGGSSRKAVINSLKHKAEFDLYVVTRHMNRARTSKASKEYKQDIREEQSKLRRRAKIYEEMNSLKEMDRITEPAQEYAEWNRAREKRLLKERIRLIEADARGEEVEEAEEPNGPAMRTRGRLARQTYQD